MLIFDGIKLAAELEVQLADQVKNLKNQGKSIKIAAILYTEDEGSRLYTRLKAEAAARAGIEYQVYEFALRSGVDAVVEKIKQLNQQSDVTGIIVQKPRRSIWMEANYIHDDGDQASIRQAFDLWWQLQVMAIDLSKDVDGLHPDQRQILPATVRGVVTLLQLQQILPNPALNILLIGKSDIFGVPMSRFLEQHDHQYTLVGVKGMQQILQQGRGLTDYDVIISATGSANLITGDLVKDGVIVVDVGEPKPDVEFATVAPKSSFITPVPGGVGPMTVVSLMQNAVELVG